MVRLFHLHRSQKGFSRAASPLSSYTRIVRGSFKTSLAQVTGQTNEIRTSKDAHR